MKHILRFSLHFALLSSLVLASTPRPTPQPILCSKEYAPICAKSKYNVKATFANICRFEKNNRIAKEHPEYIDYQPMIFLYEGHCDKQPLVTPTPYPLPSELICDSTTVTTTAYDRNFTDPHQIYLLDIAAKTNIYTVGINKQSIQFIDENGNYKNKLQIPNEGTWYNTGGTVSFQPLHDFNATSSIKYVVNNNCDYPTGVSNQATLSVRADGSIPIPADESCVFAPVSVNAINDKVTLVGNEKVKVIPILANDNLYMSSTNYVPASLRIINQNGNLKRRIYIQDKGTWLADTTKGEVLFIPDENFTGSTSIHYAIHSVCTYGQQYLEESKAKITIIAPTPTPKPCPKTKKPVCGQEKLCEVGSSGETNCLNSIPHNTTYANMCELFNAGDVFLYEGACKKPTPTPTPQVIYVYITPIPTPVATPTTTPKPTVVTPKEETKPKPPTTTPTDTNTSTSTSKVKSSNGSALGIWSILMMMLLTVMLVIMDKKRENA